MKKIIIIALTVLSINSVYSQIVERNTLLTEKINTATFDLIQKIEESDTTYFIAIKYQNMKYTSITDTEIILFNTKADYLDVIDNIKLIAEKDVNAELDYTTSNKSIIFNSKYGVFLNSKDNKYTMFNRKQYLKKYESILLFADYLK
jgi:hypothetical protein